MDDESAQLLSWIDRGIGRQIEVERVGLDITQAELATKAEIPLRTLVRYLDGTRSLKVSSLIQIAWALERTPGALFDLGVMRAARMRDRADRVPTAVLRALPADEVESTIEHPLRRVGGSSDTDVADELRDPTKPAVRAMKRAARRSSENNASNDDGASGGS